MKQKYLQTELSDVVMYMMHGHTSCNLYKIGITHEKNVYVHTKEM